MTLSSLSHLCPQCGDTVPESDRKRGHQRVYCSPRCRTRAWRERKEGATQAQLLNIRTSCGRCGSRTLDQAGRCLDCRQHEMALDLAQRLCELTRLCTEAYAINPSSGLAKEIARLKGELYRLSEEALNITGAE